jgi:hypothetical protein
MAVGFSNTNKPLNPRGQDASPKGYNRASLFSGKALDFDGVNDYVASDSFSLDTSEWSASMILKNDTAGDDQIFLTFAATGSNDESFIIYNNFANSNKISFYGAAFTGSPVVFDYVIPTDYEHLTFTFASNTLSLYVNGVFVDSGNVTGNDGTQTASAIVGARKQAFYGQYFNGQVSGLKMYSTALTAAQVADLYNNPEKVVPTGVANTALKLWLPMMEGAGTTAYDGSGNGNHGTIAGATYVNGVGAPVAQTSVIDWNKGSNIIPNIEVYGGSSISNTTGVSNDPAGRSYAVRLQKTDSGTPRYAQQSIGTTLDGNSTYVLSSFFKYDGHAFTSSLEFNNNSHWGGTAWVCPIIIASSGVTLGTPLNCTSNIVAYSNDWYRVDVTIVTGGSPGFTADYLIKMQGGSETTLLVAYAQVEKSSSVGAFVPTFGTAQTLEVLLPQGLTTGRDITGVNLFENVRKQGALNLDGNSWAEVHDNESLDVTTGLSIENWIYIEDAATQGRILSKWGSSQPNRSFQMFMNNAVVRFLIGDGSSQASLNSSTSLTEGNWHHIVSTYDGANIKIYINGSADATTTETFTIYNSNEPVLIGGYIGGTILSVNPIAQPRIYNRALTASEVLQNYNSGKNTYTND